MPLSFFIPFLLCTIFFLLANSPFGHAHNVSEVANENDEKLAHFWRSVNFLAEKSADSLGGLANSVEEIAFYLDRGSSRCYQLVEYVLRNGLHEEWTARMIHANGFLSENVLISRIADPELFETRSSFIDSSAANRCLSVLNIKVPEQSGLLGGQNLTFEGQFCLTRFSLADFNETQSLQLKNESTLSYFERVAQRWLLNRGGQKSQLLIGICVPSICKVEELEMLMVKYLENFLGHIKLEIVHCHSQSMESEDGSSWLLIVAMCTAFSTIILNLFATCGYYLVKKSLPSNSYWKNVFFRVTCCFHLGGNVRKQFEQVSAKANVHSSNHFHGCKAVLVGLIVFENCRTASEGTSVLQKVLFAAFFFICGLVKLQNLTAKQKLPNLTVYLFFTWLKFQLLVCFVFLCTILLPNLQISFRFTEDNCFLSEWPLQLLLIDNFFYNYSCRSSFLPSLLQLHLLNYLICFLFLKGKTAISCLISIATVIGFCTLTALVDLPVTATFSTVSYLLGVLFAMSMKSKFGFTFKRNSHFKTFLSQHFFHVFDRLSYCALGVNLLLLDFNLRALTPLQKSRFINVS